MNDKYRWYNWIVGPLERGSGKYFIFIATLAALLRLLIAYFQPAYIDEAFNYYISKPGWQHMLHALEPDNHTPATQLLAYPFLLLSDSIFVMRWPFIVCGLISLGLAFQLFRRFLSEKISLTLCLAFALSYQMLITDTEVRPYAPLIMFLLATWNMMIDIREKGTPLPHSSWASIWPWIAFGTVCMGVASFHLQGTICLIACGILSLRLNSKRAQTISCLILANIPSAIWAIWCRIVCTRPRQALVSENCLYENLKNILHTPTYLASLDINNWSYLLSDIQLAKIIDPTLSTISLILGAILWLTFAYGWWNMRKHSPWEADLLALNVCLLPLVMVMASSQGYLLFTRYMVPFTVPVFIFWLQTFNEAGKHQFAISLVSIGTVICIAFPFCPVLWNQYWRDTLDFIEAKKRPNDIIAMYIPYISFSFAMAYDKEHTFATIDDNYIVALRQEPSRDKLPIFPLDTEFLQPELLQDLKGYRVILVLGAQHDLNISAPVLSWFNRYYNCIDEHHRPGLQTWSTIDTYIFERR